MTLIVEPSGQACGARVTGVDLTAPLLAETVAAIRAAWLDHHVLAFPGQAMSDDDLERFTVAMGGFGVDPFIAPIPGRDHVIAVERLPDETSPLFAENWHSDWSFQARPPAGTCLFSLVIPPTGGDTLYANQHLALEAMPREMRATYEGKIAIHSAKRAYAPDGAYGDKDRAERSMDIRPSADADSTQRHPIIRRHPETGREGLFSAFGYIVGIEGMEDRPVSPAADGTLRLAEPGRVPVPPPLGAEHADDVGQPLGAPRGDRRVRGTSPAVTQDDDRGLGGRCAMNSVDQKDERHRQTLEALADVDAGRLVDEQAVQAWASRLGTPNPLSPPGC